MKVRAVIANTKLMTTQKEVLNLELVDVDAIRNANFI